MASAAVRGAPGLPCAARSCYSPRLSPIDSNNKRTYASYTSEITTECSNFDPKVHLAYQGPTKVLSMADIGYPSSKGISPVAVSEPFQLFSQEAVMEMRREIMAERVLAEYSFTSDIAPKQLRGYAPKEAKFTYDAWKNPETLAIISQIAGVDLVPVIDYEIGHINLTVPGDKAEHDEGQMIAEDDNKPVVGWHKDSYPFVCVLMMSETKDMVGGETALRTGTGEIRKVRGPNMGCAVILQGRYIEHQALRAFGGAERITSVTSFRPASPLIKDDTVLSTVRAISHLPDLYGQVLEYQLENMEARCRRMLRKVRRDLRAGVTDVAAYKEYFAFEVAALTHLMGEIVPVESVRKAFLAEDIEAERVACGEAAGAAV